MRFNITLSLLFFLPAAQLRSDAAISATVASPTAESSLPTKPEMRFAKNWFEAITMGKTGHDSWLNPKLPFSFRIGGRESGDILPAWKLTRRQHQQGQTENRELTWQDDKSGLRVVWQARRFLDYPAIEWTFWFENAGSQPVQIEDLQSLSLRLNDSDRGGSFMLHGLIGGLAGADDMLPVRKELRGAEADATVLGGVPGPSNKHMPFFNVEGSNGRGVLVGVGSPRGWWEGRFHERNSLLDVAVKDQAITLAPGQKLRGQRILLVLWEGKRLHGHNMLRQVVWKHFVPTHDGKPPVPLVSVNACFTHHGMGGFLVRAAETNLLPLVEPIAKLGAEMFIVDAGWVSDKLQEDQKEWWPANGKWQVSRVKYSNGFRPLADKLAAANIGLGLWFVTPEDPKFLAQVDELVGQGVTLFRQDGTINSPMRLQTWDIIRGKYPHLMMEGCCGGGRNIDLESMSRFHWHQKSDRWGRPEEDQCALYNVNQYFPSSLLIVYSPSQDGDDYHAWTGFGALYSLEMHPLDKNFPADKVRQQVERYKRIRHLLCGDFYPLTMECATNAPWLGYQFHRADTDCGVAFLFRRAGADSATRQIALRGLNPQKRYTLRLEGCGETKSLTGRVLAEGMAVTIPTAPGAEMIVYQPVAR